MQVFDYKNTEISNKIKKDNCNIKRKLNKTKFNKNSKKIYAKKRLKSPIKASLKGKIDTKLNLFMKQIRGYIMLRYTLYILASAHSLACASTSCITSMARVGFLLRFILTTAFTATYVLARSRLVCKNSGDSWHSSLPRNETFPSFLFIVLSGGRDRVHSPVNPSTVAFVIIRLHCHFCKRAHISSFFFF